MNKLRAEQLKQTMDRIHRIEGHTNVSGVLVINTKGLILHTSLDTTQTTAYTQQCVPLVELARATIRDTDPEDDLRFFRVRTLKHELIIAPEDKYTLIVIQKTDAQANRFIL
ncbi:predicted protein [Nematostella vectensis]|uniref:Dynein light chain roadblock n=1 Tax=Nematostella vectensis TaxID=45351 RepID=A7SFE4_NEMVE|nr:predicted protein [Nematostella vectensis]|eukprot:XP_001629604.1 predicted protein [Nematostella vectensis]